MNKNRQIKCFVAKAASVVAVVASGILATSCNNSNISLGPKSKKEYRDSKKWGNVVTQGINVDAFHSIAVTGLVDVEYTQGDEWSVTIEGNEKAVDFVRESLNVNDSTLQNSWHNAPSNMPSVCLHITAPALQNVTVSGAGDVEIKDEVALADLDIKVTGAGDVEIDYLTCENFRIDVTGAGDVDIKEVKSLSAYISTSGAGDITCKELDCSGDASLFVSGAGDMDVKLKCDNATVGVSGAGSADVNVKSETVTANVRGAGSVTLKGKTKSLTKSAGGASTINTKNLTAEKVEIVE